MVLLIATFIATILGCSARLTLTPDNVAVLQGTEATMKCSSNSSNTVLWRTLWNTSVGMRTIYTGNKIHPDFHSLYRISVIKGEVNLVVRAIEATAKTYLCEEPHSSAESASAELIVLASDPMCRKENWTNKVGMMEQRLVCRLRYAGDWAPVMEWKQISNADRAPTALTEDITNTLGNNSVESTLTVRDRQNLTVVKYVCITAFTKSHKPNTSTTATNIPEYSHTWEYHIESIEAAMGKAEANATLPVFSACVAVLVVGLIGLIGYIVHRKRKRPHHDHENLEMGTMANLEQRPFCDESDYIEIGEPLAVDKCRSSEEYYARLKERSFKEPNVYASLETNEEPNMNTEPKP